MSKLIEEINKDFERQFHRERFKALVNRAKNWLLESGVSSDLNGIFRFENGKTALLSSLKRDYMSESRGLRDKFGIISDALFSDAFGKAIELLSEDKTDGLTSAIKFSPLAERAGEQELIKWLTGISGEARPADLAIIKHFLWQVKRKLNNLPVYNHLMPLFSGTQGTGKSTAVQMLLAPLKPLCLEGKAVSFVSDERQYRSMSRAYIVFFDEMSRSEHTDIDKLKQIITATTLDYRVLYTNESDKIVQNCTFIGCANKDIRDLIRDTTGMRRFYQILINTTAFLESKGRSQLFSLVNSCDYQLIWRSINEGNNNSYLDSVDGEIKRHQQEIRPLSSIEEFLQESCLVPGPSQELLKDLFIRYQAFCKSVGRRDVVTLQTFSRDMTSRGFEKQRKSAGTFFYIDSSKYIKPGAVTVTQVEDKQIVDI